MRRLRVGVFTDMHLTAGGGYQQSLNSVLLMKQIPSDLCEWLCFTDKKANIQVLKTFGITAELLRPSLLEKLSFRLTQLAASPFLQRLIRLCFGEVAIERFSRINNLDLIYFTSPSFAAQALDRTNFLYTVWDLAHRDEVEFPEVRANFQFELREFVFSRLLPKAVAIFSDSKAGAANIQRLYGVDPNRVKVLPFSAAATLHADSSDLYTKSVDIKKKYQLVDDYVFYPAQFWAHKNHVVLLEALHLLEKKHDIILGAIFSGGDAGGNLDHIKNTAYELGILDRIKFPGFVENDEMQHLYRQSVALVMPTYFGPTNLPPIEAFSLGVPVIYPDKVTYTEQVSDAALRFEISDAESLASKLLLIARSSGQRDELVAKGFARLETLSDADRIATVSSVIEEFAKKRACWP